ncbi:Amino acid/amide ABC transporter substrate-binding protein, HAAT family [Desulfamplus magnetovallimortis]|uniref:Amino acid/amide ABC transporter substrate-binding protein, HAAT family n=1 Tax=Desulfamplus magnetovallimortis TaxID=1246637 RepID=A0A1W1H6Y2_9BACT|nr:branched-chain amino acid ABC transporter substrate-binding protein [Desulfamplus magnetovallimortis]SLM28223.1 Amino acid/amide ABC transporter substrate-binding protein, HAAT family [Desulfamplus magnetovallimortis]
MRPSICIKGIIQSSHYPPVSYHFFIFLFTIFTLLFFTGCEKEPVHSPCHDSPDCIMLEPGQTLRIGVLQALSGGNEANGISQVRSIKIALDECNSEIAGHPVKLQIEDSGCTAEMGNAAALKVAINLDTVAVIGTFCSGSAATAAKVITEAGIAMISGSNSAPSLTSTGGMAGKNWHSGYFRVMFNGTDMARATAWFAFEELGLTRAATIDDGSLYTTEYTSEFTKTFRELGGEISTAISINKGDINMLPAITSILLAKSDCLYFPIYQQEAVALVRQIKDVQKTDKIVFIGGGALLTESFLKDCGEYAKGMYFSSVITPSGGASQMLRETYIKKYGESPQHFSYAHTYDATKLLLQTIESVAVSHPDGTVVIERKALRDALYSTKDFEGVTGKLTCNKFGDCSADKFKIMRLDNPLSGLDGLKNNIVYIFDPNNAHGGYPPQSKR